MQQHWLYQNTQNFLDYIHDPNNQHRDLLAALRYSQNINDYHMNSVYPVFFRYLPEKALSTNGTPTYAENALFLAMHLNAIYVQGNHPLDGSNMSLFKALSFLRQYPQIQTALDARVSMLLQTNTFKSLEIALSGLIRILKQHSNSKVDFAALAKDVYQFQFSYQSAKKVLLRWAQDYYWTNK